MPVDVVTESDSDRPRAGVAATTDIPHPHFAGKYPKFVAQAGRRGATEHRRRLLAGLEGRVAEVGAGDGANFQLYPATVTEVIAIEPEPTLRSIAIEAAEHAPVPVRVVGGTAESLPLGDGETDAVVASLVLCSVADQARALADPGPLSAQECVDVGVDQGVAGEDAHQRSERKEGAERDCGPPAFRDAASDHDGDAHQRAGEQGHEQSRHNATAEDQAHDRCELDVAHAHATGMRQRCSE